MQIQISGQGFSVGESLKEHVEEALEAVIHKYFKQAVGAKVFISQEANHRLFHSEIIVNEGISNGAFVKGSARNFDPYISIDEAIAKINTKLRRFKGKLKDHKVKNEIDINSQLLSRYDENQEIKPKIVEEEKMSIKRLSIEDAIMHLEMMSMPALIFINAETKKLNIIYSKDNGNIVLVDTTQVCVDS